MQKKCPLEFKVTDHFTVIYYILKSKTMHESHSIVSWHTRFPSKQLDVNYVCVKISFTYTTLSLLEINIITQYLK